MKLKTIGLFVMMFSAYGLNAMKIDRNPNDSRIRRISLKKIEFNEVPLKKTSVSKFRSTLPQNHVDDIFSWLGPKSARTIRRRVSNRVSKAGFGRFLKSSGLRWQNMKWNNIFQKKNKSEQVITWEVDWSIRFMFPYVTPVFRTNRKIASKN